METALGLTAVVVLVLANGFFVATEFAIVGVRRSRLEQLEAEGNAAARRGRDLVAHLDAYIAACQLGITMASLGLGWIGEPALSHLIEPPLERLVGQFAPTAARGVSVAIAFSVITALHIVIGELAPKGLALQRAEATTMAVAAPMQLFYRVFRLPISALNAVGNGVLRLAGLRPTSGHEMVHSAAELQYLLNASSEAGAVEPSEARIASRAFVFADRTAGELMTPRTEIEGIALGAHGEDLFVRVESTRHRHLPVYDGSLDNVVGVLPTAEVLKALRRGQPVEARALARPVMSIPQSRPADELLEELRSAEYPIAVVLDEYGGTAGIITLHDLFEGLVGPVSAGGRVAEIGPVEEDGSRTLDGLANLDELSEAEDLKVPSEEREHADSVSGLFMYRLGRIPRPGDAIEVDGRTLRVESVARRRVARARLLPPGR